MVEDLIAEENLAAPEPSTRFASFAKGNLEAIRIIATVTPTKAFLNIGANRTDTAN